MSHHWCAISRQSPAVSANSTAQASASRTSGARQAGCARCAGSARQERPQAASRTLPRGRWPTIAGKLGEHGRPALALDHEAPRGGCPSPARAGRSASSAIARAASAGSLASTSEMLAVARHRSRSRLRESAAPGGPSPSLRAPCSAPRARSRAGRPRGRPRRGTGARRAPRPTRGCRRRLRARAPPAAGVRPTMWKRACGCAARIAGIQPIDGRRTRRRHWADSPSAR